MDAVSVARQEPDRAAAPACRLAWFTPGRCRAIFAALMVLGFVGHLRYLMVDCPIDLSGDEAQYWEWSRKLDWSYYSKGPLVAYIIRASCAVFGDVMWAVRLPALVLAVATSVLTYWLTRRLFGSDRLALGVVLLCHVVPMFVAGSMLMTIDPPYYFCWGLATAFFALAVLDENRWAWVACGVAIGVGTLAKYGMLIWPVGMVAFLLIDPASRRWLRTPWPWAAVGIGLLFLTPPVVWNVRHDWVTFKHVAKQTGAAEQRRLFDGNFLAFVGSQAGVLGPGVAVILGGAIVHAWRRQRVVRAGGKSASPPPPPTAGAPVGEGAPRAASGEGVGPSPARVPSPRADRAAVLLLWMGLPLFTLCVVGSVRSKMQVNWPAAAYFSWMILAGYFLATRMATPAVWRRWRVWVVVAAVFGAIFSPVAHDFETVYPLLAKIGEWRVNRAVARGVTDPKKLDDLRVDFRNADPTAKLKGWRELGLRIAAERPKLDRAFVLCEDYMQTAQTAFYTPGQPTETFCAGPYLRDPKRRTQYDVWPERSLARPDLVGRDAIYIGYLDDERKRIDGREVVVPGRVREAFASVEELPEEPIIRRGQKVRRFKLYACRGFKGMRLNETRSAY
jgi:4-amino-4-deoxy-L-arabinose transferase-like glycosyltransferase